MSPRAVFPAILSLTILSAVAETREFTDAQGRKLKAEIVETGPGWVRVRRADGHKFLLTQDNLSAADRQWLTDFTRRKTEAGAKQKRSAELQAAIVNWCRGQRGKQVGNGECWTLADEAFKSCGGKRPTSDLRVWGRKLNYPREAPQPGDIIEYRSAKFSNGSYTGSAHTAVVTGLGRKKGILLISEQNWGGVKKVHEVEFDPATLVAGEMMFYRPE